MIGSGDISPVALVQCSAIFLEAIMGHLYLTVLVGLHIAQQDRERI